MLHRSDDLTILQIVWAPGMRLFPHDHDMWACIGIDMAAVAARFDEANERWAHARGGTP
jgi:predicted metal-dependent enzyme (double-stranded beta helix superfamily)